LTLLPLASVLATDTDPAPLSLTEALKASEGFVPMEPWPPGFALRGGNEHATRELYQGDLSVQLYESKDELVKLVHQPYDEFVYVIRGEAVLTPEGRAPRVFAPGEFFLVPKGFTGTWESRHDFRELIVIERKSLERAYEYYFRSLPEPEAADGAADGRPPT
jgi:uncharacterized cupin superfamily protein